jgi:hypothetical protein
MSESEEQLIRTLRQIAMDAGDNRDRAGEYTSDKINDAISEFQKDKS